MPRRLDPAKVAPAALESMLDIESYLAKCGLDRALLHLIKMRASQINGCAYCLDMHSKDERAEGETEQRLYALDAWRETPFYSARERAALAWTEALTLLPGGVSDDVYAQASAEFSETELTYLTSAIASINTWNRFGAAYRWTPAERPKKAGAAA